MMDNEAQILDSMVLYAEERIAKRSITQIITVSALHLGMGRGEGQGMWT
jgi:hypothetical protein